MRELFLIFTIFRQNNYSKMDNLRLSLINIQWKLFKALI
jgi:hypothetical protein